MTTAQEPVPAQRHNGPAVRRAEGTSDLQLAAAALRMLRDLHDRHDDEGAAGTGFRLRLV